jgi:hypothetical protein
MYIGETLALALSLRLSESETAMTLRLATSIIAINDFT